MFKIASRKLGREPVVRDLILGKVTVGGNALDVKGIAEPDAIKLSYNDQLRIVAQTKLTCV